MAFAPCQGVTLRRNLLLWLPKMSSTTRCVMSRVLTSQVHYSFGLCTWCGKSDRDELVASCKQFTMIAFVSRIFSQIFPSVAFKPWLPRHDELKESFAPSTVQHSCMWSGWINHNETILNCNNKDKIFSLLSSIFRCHSLTCILKALARNLALIIEATFQYIYFSQMTL